MNMNSPVLRKLKLIVTQICQKYKLLEETSKSGRPKKITEINALTLALYRHKSTRMTKKSVYDDFKDELKCSYKTLVVSMNRTLIISLKILALIISHNQTNEHLIKYTDATDIPVCLKKNADKHQTMKAVSGFGRSAKGWFYGVKMTLTRDRDGRLLNIMFTDPNKNDRDIFRKINKYIKGIIVADAGYVSKDLEKDMNIEGKRWILIRPYKTMKKLMTKWQEELYRGRFQIEFDFRNLKMFHGLVTSMPRSINGYLANYIHSLTSFVLS